VINETPIWTIFLINMTVIWRTEYIIIENLSCEQKDFFIKDFCTKKNILTDEYFDRKHLKVINKDLWLKIDVVRFKVTYYNVKILGWLIIAVCRTMKNNTCVVLEILVLLLG
jgi:hypothetical protein